ncbi:MAG: peptidylprolyl isomerase [Terracidiphilus sp.]
MSEILISAGTDDPAKVAAAKAKADDLEARLHSGGDFAQLARSFSEGTTAASGGDLGQYKRGQLPKVLEDKDIQSEFGPVHRSHPHAAGLHHSEGRATHAGRT